MTEGWLNTIDMNYAPHTFSQVLNNGLFMEWYHQIEGDSFDLHTAANVFYHMVKKEKNIDLLMQARSMEPIVQSESGERYGVQGMNITTKDGINLNIQADAVIDATQNADVAAAAHVPYTVGRADIGDKKSSMAATLVFRINHMTPEVWKQIRKALKNDGNPNSSSNDMSAWGYKGMYHYPSSNPKRLAMRGLNIGRQDNETALINSLQIFGVNALSPASRTEAKQLAKQELPHILSYMKAHYPEFSNVQLDGTAPELYVRETRHIRGEYTLSIDDLLNNRDAWDRIAFGSYPADIQRTGPNNYGAVVLKPLKYAVPFRCLVPVNADGLLVVGRSASYSSLASGSARTIPVGMAEGQAAGAAVKVAISHSVSFHQLSESKPLISKLHELLSAQGMTLAPYSLPKTNYMRDPSFPGLELAVSIGFRNGGYKNNTFNLDEQSNVLRMVHFLMTAQKVYPLALPGDPNSAVSNIQKPQKKALTLPEAAYILENVSGTPASTPKAALQDLENHGYIAKSTINGIQDKNNLTDGNMFMLLHDMLQAKKELKP